mgnify:CR=1 FL=1
MAYLQIICVIHIKIHTHVTIGMYLTLTFIESVGSFTDYYIVMYMYEYVNVYVNVMYMYVHVNGSTDPLCNITITSQF